MKLIIAEKPDQARTLASVFPTKKGQGFIEVLPNKIFPKGAYVTWAIGHICELVPPEKYNPEWKKWSLDTLPMLPDRFQYTVMKDKYKQFNIIKSLIQKPEVKEIIHAGDAGREGELIIRNILRLSNAKQPMKRLWISSLTPKAIRTGFQNLLEETETRNLFFEAYTRACADWIVGMNASRLYSLLLQKKGISDVFSVGRVQTPTLALIVKREWEIENFVAEPFWEVNAEFSIDGKKYNGKWEQDGESRIFSKDQAEKIADFCREGHAQIADVKKEKKEYLPPLLYNLSALQADSNRIYKFSPKKTLDILQRLYQKGIVSYPRSDSRFVTSGEADMFPEILEKLKRIPKYKEFFPLPVRSIKNNKRYVNEKKVTDHYAIIPTEQVPIWDKLDSDEQKIYDLIVKSLLAAHYDKAIYEYTTITTIVNDQDHFITKGKVQLAEGWRKVIPPAKNEEEPELPLLEKGQTGQVSYIEVKESKTQPPKRYTEGQLITLMKTAGKYVEDKELEKVLTETEGLGTEATRAAIITMLKERKYIEIKKNLVYATAKAKILISAIGKELLASPEMTAKWEQRLKEISEGKASPKQFISLTNKMISQLVQKAKENINNLSIPDNLKEEIVPRSPKKQAIKIFGTCKLCGGSVIDKGNFYGCSQYGKNGCTFTLSKKILGKTISQTQIKKLLKEGQTDLINGFKGKEKSFSAKLIWDEKERKVKFTFN